VALFNKQDRIELSKKAVSIEDEIKSADAAILEAQINKQDLENQDSPNKKLVDEQTGLIKPYQDEAVLFDGNQRSELTEQIMKDSARRILNNSFFPNDPNSPLASLPDGLWANFIPFSRTHGIGKTNFEQFVSTGNRTEPDIIADINSTISSIESEAISERATGLECNLGVGSCTGETPPGSGTTQPLCITNGGTWSTGPDVYSSNSNVQALIGQLKSLVQEWEGILNNQKSIIPTDDPDSTRDSGNSSAVSDIDDTIAIIDSWQSVQDFDTSTSLPSGSNGSGCVAFGTLTEGYFQQSKLAPTTLQILKDEVGPRSSFISSRLADITGNDYLGSVNQDINDGSVLGTEGLYGDRFLFINLRLNTIGGTLSRKINIDRVIEVQEQIKENAELSKEALDLTISATKLNAPGTGTKFVNVKEPEKFSVGDRVYLVANEQEELSGSIKGIEGYRVELSFTVPKKYSTINMARLYKFI